MSNSTIGIRKYNSKSNSINNKKSISKEKKSYKDRLLNNGSYQDAIKSYLKDISQYKLLTFEEEKGLSKRIQKGDKEALDILINSNLRLVIKIAKVFVSKEYLLMDIIQDGNIGLIRAAKKYDYKKNVRFSTYASRWIKQMIIRALTKKKKIICIPYRKEKELKIINEAIERHIDEHSCYPTNEELSERLGISIKKIKKIKLSDVTVSYLEDINYEQSFPLENIIMNENYSPHEVFISKDVEKDTQKALDSLLLRERTILIHRFGIGNNEKCTLEEMGNFFGISPETVRQIELKTLKKLEVTYQNLKDYI